MILILNFGAIVDAYYTVESTKLAIITSALFTSLWIAVEKDLSYPSGKSKVKPIHTISEWTSILSNGEGRKFVFFCDSSISSCVDYALIHADLSAECTHVDFYLVDVTKSNDVAKKAKVFLNSHPVIVLYQSNKEIDRLPTDSTRARPDLPVNRNSGLNKCYWAKSIRNRFSLS